MIFIQAALCIALMAGLYALTKPPEMRRHRWLKLAVSFPLVLMLANAFTLVVKPGAYGSIPGGLGAIAAIVLLGFLWCGNIAHFTSRKTTSFLFGDGRGGGGFVPDYKEARWKAEAGELDAAIELTKEQLEKSPTDYEGLTFLATLYNETNRPKDALAQLDRILANPHVTDTQRHEVMGARIDLLNTHRDILS